MGWVFFYFLQARQERQAEIVHLVFLFIEENLLDVWNVLPIDCTTQALKRGINQITVVSEFLLDSFRSVVASEVHFSYLVEQVGGGSVLA